MEYVTATLPTWATAPAEYWQIKKGPFFDRFDRLGYPGARSAILALARTNDICFAAIEDCNVREFIDLKARQAELTTTLTAVSGELAAAGRPALTPAMITAILTTPTTDYERAVKGLPQPLEG